MVEQKRWFEAEILPHKDGGWTACVKQTKPADRSFFRMTQWNPELADLVADLNRNPFFRGPRGEQQLTIITPDF